MHEFEIKQTERIYQLIHHVLLRLAEWSVAADEFALLQLLENLTGLSVVWQTCSFKQLLTSHPLAFVLESGDYGKVIVCFLEQRLEEAFELFRELTSTTKA